MNTSLLNIQEIIESITEISTMVTETTIITTTMEYVCSNGEDPIMLNYELILKTNHNLPQGGTTN